ncbi:ATP-dependent zinc metalloprotease FtsH [Lactococcus kimchii]|uniref:ATP-dependent zinc metalloprotease FtsH n=1 Tax=Lactococcus sp. S-13 TaxID=2507158 RepID=UPI0010237D84|nr:ATP-dependent zinc metalloprotease FtsH [Lactococcus sp. S-13]RZI49439.1 ATP-dependent metallopeptidase FtsH/Yme1/Tma family protein [Lactococcus sp. S-13]
MNNNKQPRQGNFVKNILMWVILAIVVVVGFNFFFSNNHSNVDKISYSQLMTKLGNDDIETVTMQPSDSLITVTGEYKKPVKVDNAGSFPLLGNSTTEVKQFQAYIIPTDSIVKEIQNTAKDNDVKVSVIQASSSGMWVQILSYIIPMLLFVGVFWLMMGGMNRGGGGGGNPMSFGKSRAKQQDGKTSKVRFADVAGSEEEKQELVEVVDFLKNPKKYHDLGARIPAGVLLEGPPGTGKTLLAKAVAGEAGVPFYSISGSDFVEMFVGVGASRVRDLFENAKKTAPSIIFIDEIDAVGRQRGAGLGGGNDEREQTLNQLLVEMDGFQDNENSVIVIAATNRSDVLDPALLRPGRFDRKVLVGAPDVKGREAVLKVHAKNKPLGSDVDLHTVATQTPGYVGADLENILNEAALVAARQNKKEINAADIDEGMDRAMAGPAKKDRIQSMREREIVAYHEAGHAIVGLVLENGSTVRKVTVVPRGRIGGYMLALPDEEIMQPTNFHLQDQLASLMGGRLGEEIVFGVATPGASNDIEKATHIARSMVTEYGMSKKLGMVSYEGDHQVFIGRDYGQTKNYSEATAVMIDDEVRRILGEAYDRAKEAIETHREQHKAIAEALLKYETLDAKQIMSLFKTGKMPDEAAAAEVPEPKTFEESLSDANDFSNIHIFDDEQKDSEQTESETAE